MPKQKASTEPTRETGKHATKARMNDLPNRERLPQTRPSITHKFQINQLEGYITVGLYEDGKPGEVFVKIAKHGSTVSGLVDTIAVLTSLALQYGVPVEDLARKFEFTQFDPSGETHNEDIRHARSVVDYIFRWLGMEFSQPYRDEKERVGDKTVDDNESSSRDGKPK